MLDWSGYRPGTIELSPVSEFILERLLEISSA
jgi:hypothetical protein